MGRIRLDRGQLGRTISGEAARTLRRRAPQVLARARMRAPVDTGRLRSSGRIEYTSTFGFRPKATVIFDVDYAAVVNDGSRPHVIRPKRAKALRFRIGNRVVFATVVNHPGTKGTHFLDKALQDVLRPSGWRVTNTPTR